MIEAYFTAWIATVPAVLPIAGFINARIGFKGEAASLTSWVVGFALVAFGHFMQLGVYADASWPLLVGYAVAVCASANHLFRIEWIKAALEIFRLKLPSRDR